MGNGPLLNAQLAQRNISGLGPGNGGLGNRDQLTLQRLQAQQNSMQGNIGNVIRLGDEGSPFLDVSCRCDVPQAACPCVCICICTCTGVHCNARPGPSVLRSLLFVHAFCMYLNNHPRRRCVCGMQGGQGLGNQQGSGMLGNGLGMTPQQQALLLQQRQQQQQQILQGRPCSAAAGVAPTVRTSPRGFPRHLHATGRPSESCPLLRC